MEFSALLIPFRIMFKDCPLGEKPSSNVAEDGRGDGAGSGIKDEIDGTKDEIDEIKDEAGPPDRLSKTKARQTTKASTKERLKNDRILRGLKKRRLIVW